MRSIYTIGHSDRSLGELIEILKSHGVEVVVDVRRFPTSRRCPWFNKDNLRHALESSGIRYYWLGRELGGFREGGYERYMETEEFKEGIRRLLEIAGTGNTAILCRERLWFRCHRRFISDVLRGLGYRVVHIISGDRTYEHKRGRRIDL